MIDSREEGKEIERKDYERRTEGGKRLEEQIEDTRDRGKDTLGKKD